jgi:hypothetical protein
MSEEYIISEESDSMSQKADYEETADPEFSKDSDELELPKPSSNISLSKGDNLIISLQNQENQIMDYLCEVYNIVVDDELLQLQTDTKEILNFIYNSENDIILQTETYHIIELYHVESFKYEDLDKPSLMMTKDIYSDIELLVTKLESNKVYSLYEQKHSIITELISLFKAQGDELLIHNIYETVDIFQEIINKHKDTYSDNTDVFQFIKNMIYQEKFELPKWCIPITGVKKRLFKTEDEDFSEYPDIINTVFEEFLQLYEKAIDLETNPNYKQIIQNISLLKPFDVQSIQDSISYSGQHIRNCNENDPCNGLSKTYYPEILQTKKELKIPQYDKKQTNFEVVSSKENINVSGFYSLPPKYFPYTKTQKSFSLYENHLVSEYNFSYQPFSKKFRSEQIIPSIIGKETINTTILQHDNIHSFLFNQKFNQQDIGNILKQNFPSISDFINSYPEKLLKQIYSFKDLELLCSPYNISIHHLSPDKKLDMIQTIQANIKDYIRDYNKSIKRKVVKKLKQQIKVLSEEEKIQLSKQYIYSLSNIPLRNHYIKKTIQRFSRKAKGDENPQFMYEKNSPSILFCNHYHYTCECHKDAELFHTMKSLYGNPPKDGIITCNVCGEYLCHEEFSSFQGYTEGATTLEVAKEDDPTDLLSEEQQKLFTVIKKINSFLSIELTLYDTKRILDYLQLSKQQDFMNHRYKTIDSFKKHPRYQEIFDEFPSIPKPKTSEEKKQNKKNQRERMNKLKELKAYLEDCNNFLLITFLSLFHLQTSMPPYVSAIKNKMNLFNDFTPDQIWSSLKSSYNELVSIYTTDNLFIQILQYTKNKQKDPFWEHIQLFLSESDSFSVPAFKEQFSETLPFILKNEPFNQSFKIYFEYQQTSIRNLYIQESWASYKPQKDNSIVQSINQSIQNEFETSDIQDSLLKQRNDFTYENISTIIPIQISKEIPRHKLLEIPYSAIMRNESYQRLFRYSIHLHGTTKQISHPINLQMSQFLETTDYSDEITSILQTIGWNSETKQMNTFNYSDLRRVIIKDIIDLFIDKEPSNKETLQTFIHIGLNNWNGMLLNANPKRYYNYTEPVIFPDENFETIQEINPSLIESIYNCFCLDDDNEIQYRYSNDDFILNLVADPTIEREAICDKLLQKNNDTFQSILDFKRNSTKHKLFIPHIIDTTKILEDRLDSFVQKNQLLTFNASNSYPIFKKILQIPEQPPEQQSNEWDIIISSMLSLNESMKENIQEFFINHKDSLRPEQSKRYNSLFGRSIDSMNIILTKLLEKDRNIHNTVKMMFRIIGRISHDRDQQGTILHNHIPKQWKLSDTNETYFKEFISINEFLLHNDLFIKQKNIPGFNYYKREPKFQSCFKQLYSFMGPHMINELNTILGDENTYFTKEYSRIFQEHIFLSTYSLILNYIDDMKEKNTSDLNQSGELYSSLIQRDYSETNDCISILIQFSFDLIIHIIEEYIDPNWIYQEKLSISTKIGKQKEREKQTIIESLESKTDDHRLVSGFLQNYGIIEGAYKGSEKSNLEHIESSIYEQQMQKDTTEAVMNLLESPEEDGYSQYDQDREDEGLDDNDDDGDYHDN